MIRPATPEDAAAVARIYNHYVERTVVTFEETPVPPVEMARRMRQVAASGCPWFVCEREGEVLGYAYASRWNPRCSYRLSLETTVYLASGSERRGLGGALYAALLDRLRAAGFHCAIGGIALPNEASVGLHEKLGFEKVGHFREVGRKHGRWVDVGYWQLML